ncbi:nucleoside phosphorylase [Furfurilactobacillus sp. WILCCON 0119]
MNLKSPLFNYDANPNSVVSPTEDPEFTGFAKCLFAFVEDKDLQTFFEDYDVEQVFQFENITKQFPIWRLTIENEAIMVAQAPLGAPAAVQFLDYLIGHGAKQIISLGSCGVLTKRPEAAFLVPFTALRDEGTSYHYLPAAPTIKLNETMQTTIERQINRTGRTTSRVKTWTTDAFFRETQALIEEYRAAGYETVEMECAALAACAEFRQVAFGQFFFTADSLADSNNYDKRGWGFSARQEALQMGLAILLHLE